MLQYETISEDQLTSAASHESEQILETEQEQEQIRELEITEPTVSGAMSTRRSSDSGASGRVSKQVNKFELLRSSWATKPSQS